MTHCVEGHIYRIMTKEKGGRGRYGASNRQKIARKRVHDIMRPCKGEGLYYRMQLKQKREDRFSYCRG